MSNALEKARLAREAQEKEAKNRTQELNKRRNELLNIVKTWIVQHVNLAYSSPYEAMPRGNYVVCNNAREAYVKVEEKYVQILESLPESELDDQVLSSIEYNFKTEMARLDNLLPRLEEAYLASIGAKSRTLKDYKKETSFPNNEIPLSQAIETIRPLYEKVLFAKDEEEVDAILAEFSKKTADYADKRKDESEIQDIYNKLDPQETNLTLVANYGVLCVRFAEKYGLDMLTDYHALNGYDRLLRASKLKRPDVYEALAVLYDAGTKTGIPNPRKAAKCRAKAAKLRAKGFKGYKE